MDNGLIFRLYFTMLSRFLLSLIFALGLGAKAWAFDCLPWSGKVSEFAENYVSVWAVPTAASLETKWEDNWVWENVTYTVEVLEGFGRVDTANIKVVTNLADNNSGGVALKMGTPQFISGYKSKTDDYGLSTCTPMVPYTILKQYLETGQDNFIPYWSSCHSWPEEGDLNTPIFHEKQKECAIWKGASEDYENAPDGRYGHQDFGKYYKIWRDKIKS